MLRELRIKNFSIVEDQRLEFSNGMVAFTGETGAGKSLLLDAITLLLGTKADADLIRPGEGSAEVEGVFDLSKDLAKQKLAEELGFECDASEGALLYVRREISGRDLKRNRIWIQGTSATRLQLQQLLGSWVEISGQHEFLRLGKDDFILSIVDEYGNLGDQLRTFQHLMAELHELRKQLKQLRELQSSKEQRLDYLRFQFEELNQAGVDEGLLAQENQLLSLKERLSNTEKLRLSCENAARFIEGWDSEEALTQLGIKGQIQRIKNDFVSYRSFGLEYEELYQNLVLIEEHTSELAHQLQSLNGHLEADPEALEKTEAQISLLKKLQRKYNLDTQGLVTLKKELSVEIEELSNSELKVGALAQRLESVERDALKKAESLHKDRERAASNLEKLWQEGIRNLGMKQGKIKLELESTSQLRPTGKTLLRALFSANLGMEPKVLSKVASGGELSRILLALKKIVARQSEVHVYLFDEVDTGIGGETAKIVGKELRLLAQENQVLVVTHLAQIAASAHQQFCIEKRSVQGKTRTRIQELQAKNRLEELSRMLGSTSSSAALELAQELLTDSQQPSRASSIPPAPTRNA